MNVNDPADPLLPPPPRGHHRSARERQRKGPMWGCLKALILIFGGAAIVLLFVVGGGWWYLGTTNFADLVRLRVEKTLESRLGRDVQIGSVQIVRTHPQKIIINDLRIANARGGVAPYFARVRQVVITGGVESFWSRSVKVSRVDISDPQLWFEIFPEGSALTHNFPHWESGPKRRYEIVHLNIGQLFINNGRFSFLDRRHDIEAVASRITSHVTVTGAEDLYEGVMQSPFMRVRLQDYEPFDTTLRGGFRYTPGVLDLRSVAVEGRGIEMFLAGRLAPLTEGVYDLHLTSRVALERVRQIFRVEKLLAGNVALDTRLRGKQGEFGMTGGWTSPRIAADTYELENARGTLNLTNENLTVDVQKASYGGGNIAAHYLLSKYAEPYPMKVDLRYYGISIEQLFSDWTVEGIGLRGAATGSLAYHWNKDKILEGGGEGTAKLARTATAFSRATYPIPVGGSTDFALNRGVVTFRRLDLDTPASHVSLTGTLKIEGIVTNLRADIRTSDFGELDRIGYNFAHSAGKKDYTLLGLGGAGTVTGTIAGPIDKPEVAAHAVGTGTKYNNVLVGDSDITLRYDGKSSTMTFDRAAFADAGGRLALTGTVAFPDKGPSPRFDIAVESNSYPAQRAIDAIGLDMKIGSGLATGKMIVAGTGESGRATFADVVIRRADATLRLNGTTAWKPGKGNVTFDLDIAATNFPVADIMAFLDFGPMPVSGDLTGTLHIAGPKDELEGRGRIDIRNGAIYGEPVQSASADIAFTKGRMRATNLLVRAAAGEIRGEAELDLATEKFSYTIQSSSLDLSKIKLLESARTLLGGKLVIQSSGAGTFNQPEIVLEATLNEATISGLSLPAGAAPPSLYIAIRNGQLIVRGQIADIVSIEGQGSVGPNLAVNGNVRVTVSDIARAVALSPKTATIPAAGNLVMDLALSGKLTPIDALVVDATVPVLNLTVSDHPFTAPQPLHIALRHGRVSLESFALQSADTSFAATGFAELTGAKRLNIGVQGRIEAALLQLFVSDVRAEGRADVAMSIEGTMDTPRVTGTAELHDAQIKFAGFPQLIDQINGTLRFRGDRILIESVRATVGGGTIVAGGAIYLEGMTPSRARVTLQGTDVALRYYEGVTVQGNFNLLLSGDLERATLQGDVDVTRALYFRDFDIQQTILSAILARNRVVPVTAATWQDRIGLRIHLNAPGTLAVRNNLADVTGSATFDVTGTVANPVILGELTLDEGGSVRIQNVDYRVVRGTIAFQNPFRIDPYFDVTIEGVVSGNVSEIESGPIDVTVNLTGTLDRLTPSITSDPPASDITLFSILGFGGLGGGRTGTATQPGFGLIGQSLLYQSLSSLIGSKVLPFVDSFAYDPGTLETGTGAGPRVTFEKRLSNKIRFLLVYNLNNQQSRQVMEWIVNNEWTLQLTRDETDEYRVDARFRRRYEAHWELGDHGDTQFARGAVMTPAAGAGAPPSEAPPALPAAPPTTNVNPQAAKGAPIVRINFRADSRFDTSTLAREVTLKPGAAITVRELQASIKNLFATGNFRDIRVDASPVEGGVDVTFSLYLNYRIAAIHVDGLARRERMRAERDLTLRTGAVLSLDAVEDNARALEDSLHRYGKLEATVDPETTFDRLRNSAVVTFHVTPGPQATIASVDIEGQLAPFTAQQLIARMKRRPGRSFQLPEARSDAERIKNFLVRRNYRRAEVDFLSHTYDAPTHSVRLRYRVNVGPTVRVEVAGVPRRSVRKWLPFARNQEYSEDVVDQAADNIVKGLQQRGYYHAAVDTSTRAEGNEWIVTFEVSPGVQYRLSAVTFSGNAQVPDKKLADAITTSARGGFRRILATMFRRPTGVTRQQLSDDRDAIESYYRLHGFSTATAATPVVVTNDTTRTMVVEFPVTEGPQTILTAVKIEGVDHHHHPDVPKPTLRAGAPLNPQAEHDDVVALQTYYADSGHTEVQVAPRVEVSPDKREAQLTYVVSEGPHVNIGDVVVRGNSYTKDEVVLRKSGLTPGEPFSYTRILEAQRDLYRLGIFNRVEIQPQQAGTSTADRNVTIEVEEGRDLTLTGALGLRAQRGVVTGRGLDVSPRLAIAAAHRNLFGTGRYLGLEVITSRDQQEAYLTYREPFISRWNVPLQLQVFQADDATRPGTHIQQRGTSVELQKVVRTQTRWSLRYEYKISNCIQGTVCDAVRAGDPVADLDRSLLNIAISNITPTFFWDTRDDIIDPHRGFFTSASVEYAFPLFSAKADFTKEYVQGAYYIPLTPRTVIALSGRLGLIQPMGGTDHSDVPLSERFTAGGETSHRAFPLDRLGELCYDANNQAIPGCQPTLFQHRDPLTGKPDGPILPLGGSGLLLFNAEYRFPIAGPVGGAIFGDAGNVYKDDTIRFDELRYGAGFGIRYLSPVGPLRIDIGMPFDRRWYEDRFQYFFTLGYAF